MTVTLWVIIFTTSGLALSLKGGSNPQGYILFPLYGSSGGFLIGLLLLYFKKGSREKYFKQLAIFYPFVWIILFYAHFLILDKCNSNLVTYTCNDLSFNDFYINSPIYLGFPLVYFIQSFLLKKSIK